MDDFENDLRRTLDDRAAALPDAYDAPDAMLARVRRRRALKQGALALSIVLVVSGSVAAIASVVGRDDSKHVVSALSGPTTTVAATTTTNISIAPAPSIPTVVCPVLAANADDHPAPPSTAPRAPAVGKPAQWLALASFAGTTGARYRVLGPKTWACLTSFGANGSSGVEVYSPHVSPGRVPSFDEAPIVVQNDWLWHGLFPLPCQVSTAPAVLAHAANVGMTCAVPAGRTLVRVAGRGLTLAGRDISTFTDADGARGVAWLKLPSSPSADDGLISVLTCRPTAGLSVATCETIVADYIGRVAAT